MATQKQGMTVHASQWWKHLRPYCKRQFWKKQRKADKRALRRNTCAPTTLPSE